MNLKSDILAVIKINRSIKRSRLLAQINAYLEYNELNLISDRKLRNLIVELIEEGAPIASSEKGYSLIRTAEDLQNAMKYLKAKAYPLFDRAKHLHKNFHKDNAQLAIEEFLRP